MLRLYLSILHLRTYVHANIPTSASGLLADFADTGAGSDDAFGQLSHWAVL